MVKILLFLNLQKMSSQKFKVYASTFKSSNTNKYHLATFNTVLGNEPDKSVRVEYKNIREENSHTADFIDVHHMVQTERNPIA
jgi:hypothetical protein